MTGSLTAPGGALASARRVADAVLHEGYVLFPYRAAATKNHYRWQFGVVIPAAQAEVGTAEPHEIVSQLLVNCGDAARVEASAGFLHARRRRVERRGRDDGFEEVDEMVIAGALHTTWDEGIERDIATGPVTIDELLTRPREKRLRIDAHREVSEPGDGEGRVVQEVEPLDVELTMAAERLDAGVVRLTTTVRNLTEWAEPRAPREEIVRHALLGTYLLFVTEDASFASAIDPPPWADPWLDRCRNRHTYPVLVGEPGVDQVVLSAPIILEDRPSVAPESPGASYDATEIDELLTLTVLSLTEDEKRRARATDPRAADVVDRAESLSPDAWERLHGAVRAVESRRGPGEADPRDLPKGDRADIDEELADFLGLDESPVNHTVVGGRRVTVGDKVVLRPNRRADAQDLFLSGRTATVERIVVDVDGATHLAVTVDDDPASDLHRWYGRHSYFRPDEIEPTSEEE